MFKEKPFVMEYNEVLVQGIIDVFWFDGDDLYLLDYKTKDRDLKGEKLPNGEYSYVSHVDYWMPFYGGYGFHDASWRSRFGGSIYNYSGSHGCINTPYEKMEQLYERTEIGTPVIMFY